MRPLLLWLSVMPLLIFSACGVKKTVSSAAETPAHDTLTTLTVLTTSGQAFDFKVELATTDDQHARGLMHRESMPANQGMLFIFPQDGYRTFWMKNTLIPLDMLFLSKDYEVLGIVHEAAPLTTTTRAINKPSRHVLELNGGTCKKLGITVGSKIIITH